MTENPTPTTLAELVGVFATQIEGIEADLASRFPEHEYLYGAGADDPASEYQQAVADANSEAADLAHTLVRDARRARLIR